VPAAIHTPVLIVGAASPGCPTATTARSGGGWGIDLEGARAADGHHTAVVEADLNLALRGRRVSIAYLQQPRPFTTLMAHDDQGRRWSSDAGSDPRRASPEDFSDDRVAELGRTAGGLPGLAVRLRPQVPGTDLEVLASHRRPPRRQRSPAGCCRLGRRACLAADRGPGRQHRHPDAHSLAWRLAAAVVKGTAGAGLLDTYDQERRSIGGSLPGGVGLGRGQPPGAGARRPRRRGSHPGRGGRPRLGGRGALLVRPDGVVAGPSIGPSRPPPRAGVRRAVVNPQRRRRGHLGGAPASVKSSRSSKPPQASTLHAALTSRQSDPGNRKCSHDRATSHHHSHRWPPATDLGERAAAQRAGGGWAWSTATPCWCWSTWRCCR
jgi:hypothetical protein